MARRIAKTSTTKKVLAVMANTFLVLIIAIGIIIAFSILPIKNNFKILAVMSGSMEPTIATGSLVVIKPTSEYKTGDIITFRNKQSTREEDFTTHRIIEVKLKNSVTVYVTKGDANKTNDTENVSLNQVVGKYRLHVALLGYLTGFIKTLPGLILIIIIPAGFIIYEEVKKIRLEAKQMSSKKVQKKKNDISDKKTENKISKRKQIKSKNKKRLEDEKIT